MWLLRADLRAEPGRAEIQRRLVEPGRSAIAASGIHHGSDRPVDVGNALVSSVESGGRRQQTAAGMAAWPRRVRLWRRLRWVPARIDRGNRAQPLQRQPWNWRVATHSVD